MTLPASIEAHLREVGFSQTELLILRHSLNGKPQSLRELAVRTGKSTGVLDQAMKKLLQRKIMKKEMINGSSRFVLTSLETIARWVEEDVQERTQNLLRKKEAFSSFVQTFQTNGARPKVEYFDGEEGIKKAYMQLLDMKYKELFQFLPMEIKEEEHPFCEIKANFNRERKKRNISLHVLTHDCTLGRIFKFKDEFCNRFTTLVSEQQCTIPFEKIICGDCVACFKHNEKQAFFIHFAELAEGEKKVFENYCRNGFSNIKKEQTTEKNTKHFFPFSNRTFINICLVTAIFSVLFTYFLYRHNYSLNTERVKDQVRSIATNSVSNFSFKDIQNIQTLKDVNTDDYSSLINKLATIKQRNIDVIYAYILRPTNDKYLYEFVADADSGNIHSYDDLNEDGLRNDIIAPGHIYIDEKPEISAISRAMKGKSTADEYPVHDMWGTWISGHAPILDSLGNVIAILGIDMNASKIFVLTFKDFAPLFYFIIIFTLFLLSQIVGALCSYKKSTCAQQI